MDDNTSLTPHNPAQVPDLPAPVPWIPTRLQVRFLLQLAASPLTPSRMLSEAAGISPNRPARWRRRDQGYRVTEQMIRSDPRVASTFTLIWSQPLAAGTLARNAGMDGRTGTDAALALLREARERAMMGSPGGLEQAVERVLAKRQAESESR